MPAFDIATLVDAVIVLTLVECAVLVLYHRRTGAGVAPREVGPNLLSGLCLMAALHCLARDAGGPSILLCLAAAGALHVVDLARRWSRLPTDRFPRTPLSATPSHRRPLA